MPSMEDFDSLARRLVQTHSWFKNAEVLKKFGSDPLVSVNRELKECFYNAKVNLRKSKKGERTYYYPESSDKYSME